MATRKFFKGETYTFSATGSGTNMNNFVLKSATDEYNATKNIRSNLYISTVSKSSAVPLLIEYGGVGDTIPQIKIYNTASTGNASITCISNAKTWTQGIDEDGDITLMGTNVSPEVGKVFWYDDSAGRLILEQGADLWIDDDVHVGEPTGKYGTPDGNDLAVAGQIFQEGSGGFEGYKLKLGEPTVGPAGEGDMAIEGDLLVSGSITMRGDKRIEKFENNADGSNSKPLIYNSAMHEEVAWIVQGHDREAESDQKGLFGYSTGNDNGGANGAVILTYDGSTWRWTKFKSNGTLSSDHGVTSDSRLKKNIKTLTGSLENIKKLRGVSFDWIETTSQSFGFIAQEVEEIYPEMVYDDIVSLKDGPIHCTASDTPTLRYGSHKDGYNNPDDPTDTNWGRGSMKVLSQGHIVPVLVEAMKEQQVIIEDLKARIEALENK